VFEILSSLSADTSTPPDKVVMVLEAVLPSLVGVAVFFGFSRLEPSNPWRNARWAAFLPLGYGIWTGSVYVGRIQSYLYKQFHLIGPNLTLLHWVILALPVLTVIGLAVWSLLDNRRPKHDF
jgi:hypothetical protein